LTEGAAVLTCRQEERPAAAAEKGGDTSQALEVDAQVAFPRGSPNDPFWYHSQMSWWDRYQAWQPESSWDRYQAWQPESSWDRYQAWRFESRTHFVTTGAGLRVLIVFFLSLFTASSVGRALMVTAIFAVLAILLWWFWYYPRAKAKSQHTSVPAHTTQV